MNSRLRVCFLTDDPSPVGGGPEHIRQVAEILKGKYHLDVGVVTPLSMDPEFNLSNFWHRVRYALWILRFLLTSDYDVYHSHTFSTSVFLPVVKLFGKKAGITVHGLGVNLIGGGVLNKTSLPQFISRLILFRYPFDFRLSAGKIPGLKYVGNGVNVEEFDREKSKPSPKSFTVLCVSRRDPVKGVEILEQAVKTVQKDYPQVRLNLVSGRLRTAKDFKTADLYVLPSLSEGFPIVLLEAMAAKLPIITTDVGDCRDLIEKAQAGYIVSPGDANALGTLIIRIIRQNEEQRKKMGENGYNFVKDNYTWEKVARKVYETYKEILPQ